MKNKETRPESSGFGILGLRNWDMTLLGRYRPKYHPVNKACSLCALGPCDLDRGRKGACGQNLEAFVAREALVIAVTGAAAHAAHARDVVRGLIERRGPDFPLDLGEWIQIRMPITLIVTGASPRRLGDLIPVLEYIDSEIVKLLAAAHFGGESSPLDLGSKTLHAGMMDILSMEVAEIAQVSGFGLPKGGPETPVIPLGARDLTGFSPLILCIGHNSGVAYRVVQNLDEAGLDKDIEVAGLCCTAHELARGTLAGRGDGSPICSSGDSGHVPGIVGNLRDQLRFIREGRADVVVVDQQCIRLDLLPETLKSGAFFIATSDQLCAGLKDETDRDPEEIARELSCRPVRAVFISDEEKAARLAVALARRYGHIAGPRGPQGPGVGREGAGLTEAVSRCTHCGLCTKHCPLSLPVSELVFSYKEAIRLSTETVASLKGLSPESGPEDLYSSCIACGRCDSACPENIPVMEVLCSSDTVYSAAGSMRAGRGPVDDYEIKATGPSIVLGEIPGVVAFLTCPGNGDGGESLSWMARLLAERGYIVLAAGCSAMDIGKTDGRIYHDFPGTFERGGVVNTGSCVSSADAIGALIKVASIFLHRRLEGNFPEIADYILNRIGAVVVMWGGITPKSFAASAGANRLGIPVVFGTQGRKFRRTLEGGNEQAHVFDSRSGEKVMSPLTPPHLCVVAETREEALVRITRLCMRPNDTTWGRQTKLHHYVELSETLLGRTPPDLADCVRVYDDLPDDRREELLRILEGTDWRPSYIPDPTVLEGLTRHQKKAT